MSKGFDHSRLDHQNQSLVVGRWSFGMRRSFETRERPMTND